MIIDALVDWLYGLAYALNRIERAVRWLGASAGEWLGLS